MGNNAQGVHILDQCVQYPGRHFRLNMLDSQPPANLISSYYLKRHLVFVTHEAVECFVETQKAAEYDPPYMTTIDCCCLSNNGLFIAESTGVITVLEPVDLVVQTCLKPSRLLPGRTVCMIESQGVMYLGHLGGDITIWNSSTGDFVSEHLSPFISPIEHLCVSTRYSLLIAASGHNAPNSKLRILSTKKASCKSLAGVSTNLAGILVFDEKNLVFAVDQANHILLWDIITGDLLLSSVMPEFFPASIASCVCRTRLGALGFAVGFTGNSVAWGELKFSDEHCQYFFAWKGRAKTAVDGNAADVRYCEETVGLMISCDRPLVLSLNELSKETKSLVGKKPLFALSEHAESNDCSTNIRVYQRKLTNKVVRESRGTVGIVAEDKVGTVSEDVVKRIRERFDGKQVDKGVGEGKNVDEKVKEKRDKNIEVQEKEIEAVNVIRLGEKNFRDIDDDKNRLREIPELVHKEEMHVGGKNGKAYEESKCTGGIEKEVEKIEQKKELEIVAIESDGKLKEIEIKIEDIKVDETKECQIAQIGSEVEILVSESINLNANNDALEDFEKTRTHKAELLITDMRPNFETNPILSEMQESIVKDIRFSTEEKSEADSKAIELVSLEPQNHSLPKTIIEDHLLPQSLPKEPSSPKLVISEPNPFQLSDFPHNSLNPEYSENPKEIPEKPKNITESLHPEPTSIKSHPQSLFLDSLPIELHLPSVNPFPIPPNPIPEESKSSPNPPAPKKRLSPFQIYLNQQKPELLKSNPSLTHKEIVLKVSQLWVELSETEKKQYETSTSDA